MSEDLREKGMCYRCHEKYFPGHQCKPKTLNAITWKGTENQQEETTQALIDEDQQEETTQALIDEGDTSGVVKEDIQRGDKEVMEIFVCVAGL